MKRILLALGFVSLFAFIHHRRARARADEWFWHDA